MKHFLFTLFMILPISTFAYPKLSTNSVSIYNTSYNSASYNINIPLKSNLYINSSFYDDNQKDNNIKDAKDLITLDSQNEVIEPPLVTYVTSLSDKFNSDLHFIEHVCQGANMENNAQIKLFSKCFNENKNNLHSVIFKNSIALSIVFFNGNKEKVKKEFVQTYKNELEQIHSIALASYMPPAVFKDEFTSLFKHILADSYTQNKKIAGDNIELSSAVDTYFLVLAKELDSVLLSYKD